MVGWQPADSGVKPGKTATLFLFANDWRSKYGNNMSVPAEEGGPLTLAITRTG